MSSEIFLDVHKTGILQALPHWFSNKTTFLSEALQNSRRAGATQITIQWSPETHLLRMEDNGRGIDDFTLLFTIGQTGWDLDTIAREHPFGIGTAALLVAATHLTIESHHTKVACDTQPVLEGGPIVPFTRSSSAPPFVTGTRITMALNPEYLQGIDLKRRLTDMVKGFPIPVQFNEEDLPRPHAQTQDFHETTSGFLKLCPDHLQSSYKIVAAYLQGLPVLFHQQSELHAPYFHHRDHYQSAIIHLDPDQFMARVPDRTTLLENKDYDTQLLETLRGTWRNWLIHQQHQLSPEAFVDQYYRACRTTENTDLLNTFPLPRKSYYAFHHIPIRATGWEDQTFTPDTRPTPTNLPDCFLASGLEEEEDSLVNAYAWAKQAVFVKDHFFDQAHWVHPHLQELLHYTFSATAINPQTIGEVHTYECFNIDLLLCDALLITPTTDVPNLPPLPPVTIDQAFVFDPTEGCFYFPRKAIKTTGDYENLLRQTSTYLDEHERSQDLALQNDIDTIQSLITMALQKDPTILLSYHLNSLEPSFWPFLQNRQFTIAFHHDHTLTVQESTPPSHAP